jgi:hypothetical protein
LPGSARHLPAPRLSAGTMVLNGLQQPPPDREGMNMQRLCIGTHWEATLSPVGISTSEQPFFPMWELWLRDLLQVENQIWG